MIKFIITFAVSAIIMLASCGNSGQAKDSGNNPPMLFDTTIADINFRMETFEAGNGFGYDIYVGGKRQIHQDVIPVMAGLKPFKTREDAYAVGRLALLKVIIYGTLPTLEVQELKDLNVNL